MRERPDNEWFAKQLGERWQTSGDGIYRLEGEPAEVADHDLADDLERSFGAEDSDHKAAGSVADERGVVEWSG